MPRTECRVLNVHHTPLLSVPIQFVGILRAHLIQLLHLLEVVKPVKMDTIQILIANSANVKDLSLLVQEIKSIQLMDLVAPTVIHPHIQILKEHNVLQYAQHQGRSMLLGKHIVTHVLMQTYNCKCILRHCGFACISGHLQACLVISLPSTR